jgi:hypothetical protein
MTTEFIIVLSSGIMSGPYPTREAVTVRARELSAFHGGVEIITLDPAVSIWDVAMDRNAIFIAERNSSNDQ